LSYDDLSVIEPDDLMEMGGLNEEQVDHIVNQAEDEAAKAEAIAEEKKRLQREQARLEAESGGAATPPVTETPPATEAEASAETNAEASPDADAPTEAGGEEPS
jgi:N utilization substance protein A